ncbi:hypothetical protein [Sporisorium scitamineum]|nr:hypothetical protein [Sporisorium scitamineum]
MPIEFGGGDGHMDFGSLPGFPATDVAMSTGPDFDALTAQIAASMPPLPAAPYPTATETSQPYPAAPSIKMELDDPSNVATSSSTPAAASTPQPSAPKAKKPAKPKAEGAEAKPKKPKKKPATDAATPVAAGPSTPAAQSSKDTAASPAPASKPKKASKKKPADKDKSKEPAPSATASPAPFATPASPSKDSKPKPKKAAGSKAGGKAARKARTSTARSASRMSSIGRDAATPAASRIGSQRPHDQANDDEEPEPTPAAPQEEEEAEDEEAGADDGVEELGKDHFSTQEAIYAAQQRNMGLLSMVMDEDQLDRHMASRRGALNKTSVRKLVNHVLSQSVSQHVAMVVSGVAKIFVGEIIEKAREIQSTRGEQGPLRPNHLREAHRQYYLKRERPGYYPPGTNTGFPGVGKRRRMF